MGWCLELIVNNTPHSLHFSTHNYNEMLPEVDYDVMRAGRGENAVRTIKTAVITDHHGHSFTKKTFTRPVNCHHCTEYLWGFINTGFLCDGKSTMSYIFSLINLTVILVCNFLVHEKCLKTVQNPCVGVAATLVKVFSKHLFQRN